MRKKKDRNTRQSGAGRPVCRVSAAALAAVLACTAVPAGSSGMQALAASPESARTPEEWDRLRDNVLEYDEIEDLIEEYNATVQKNNEEWEKADQGKALEDYVEDAKRVVEGYNYQAANAEDDLTRITAEYQARMAEIQVQNTIDEAEDSTTKWWSLEKAAKSLAAEAQSSMNTYYQLQYQLAAAQKNRELMAAVLENTKRQQDASVGTATYADVLSAEQNLQDLDTQILSLQNQIEVTRQNLIVMLGWEQSAWPEIGPVPAPDLNRIGAMNPEEDLAAAYEHDYTLLTDQRKVSNSVSRSGETVHAEAVENDRQQIAMALNSAYQSVLSAKAAYDQSALSLDVAGQSCSLARARQQVGLGTSLETLQAETDLVTAQTDLKIKELQLFDAMETYEWVKKGVR